MEAHERTERLSASPPLFKSEFLNFFSRVHPAIPAIIFIPVIVAAEWIGATKGWSVPQILLISVAGLAFWTLTEYWLHRLIFHWEPDNAFGHRMHFIIHGIHHDHPNDKMRLVMPPSVSIPLAALFFVGFWLVLGDAAFPAFGGFMLGYLAYDYTHYYLHHVTPRSTIGKKLREQHMRHHFQDHRYGYGVSTPIWDVAFRTLPRKRNRSRERRNGAGRDRKPTPPARTVRGAPQAGTSRTAGPVSVPTTGELRSPGRTQLANRSERPGCADPDRSTRDDQINRQKRPRRGRS